MDIMAMTVLLTDNGGRRLGIDRRQFSYTNHIPDRRRGHDRRTGLDRRARVDRRNGEIIIKKNKKDLRKGKNRRSNSERRVNFSTALAI
jgi:hypothetical protein